MPDMVTAALLWLRWPVIFLSALVGISVIYGFAPNRKIKRWQGISMGAVTATVLWVLVSGAFSLYVSHFGKYNQAYGSLGAVIVLLLWFWLAAMAILYGAEVDALRASGRKARQEEGKDALQAGDK
jgi:membrane protein